MKLDDIYVCYENAGKYFPDYCSAWNNHYKSMVKKVNYVFTPTQVLCKNVSQLYRCADKYFKRFGFDYIDICNKSFVKQHNLFDIKNF